MSGDESRSDDFELSEVIQQKIMGMVGDLQVDPNLRARITEHPIRVMAEYGLDLRVAGMLLGEIGYANLDELDPTATEEQRQAAHAMEDVWGKKKPDCIDKDKKGCGLWSTKDKSLDCTIVDLRPEAIWQSPKEMEGADRAEDSSFEEGEGANRAEDSSFEEGEGANRAEDSSFEEE